MPLDPIEIVPAGAGRARRAFLDLPYRLHAGDPCFVPPLRRERRRFFDPARHPFFEHADAAFWIARRGGRAVGRIEAVVNHAHNRFHGDRVGFFGAFECENDEAVARALCAEAARWLGAHGMTAMRGPLTHSTNEEVGLLVDGFETPPYVGMPFNPRHYPALLDAAGLGKARDVYTWEADLSVPIPERFSRLAELAARRAGVTVRACDPRDYLGDARRLMAVYNSAWEKNWGFVPLTEREFLDAAEQLRPLITRQPEGVVIIEAAGEPVAFCIGVIDANEALRRVGNGRLWPFGFFRLLRGLASVTQARLMALGVRPDYRQRGLDVILVLRLLELGRRLGLARAEVGWILDDNDTVHATVALACGPAGFRRARTYRVYEQALG